VTDQQPDRLHKIQSDLIDISGRLNTLARDFQQLAAALPAELPNPREQHPPAPYRPAPYQPAPYQPAPSQPGPVQPGPVQPGAVRPAPSQPPAPQPMQPGGWGQPGRYPTAAAPTPGVQMTPRTPPPRPPAPAIRKPRRQVSIAEIFSIAGSAITLLGVAFVLLLPADGFLGQLPRAGIGLGLAAIAIVVALLQHRKEPGNVGSQALMGTGVASAFLTVLALSSLYRGPDQRPLLPEVAGIVLAGAISLGGVSVARWWRSQWLAVLAVLGSLILAPYLGGDNALWPMSFMLVMTLVTAAFQHKLDWVALLVARVVPTVGYFVWVLQPFEHQPSLNPIIGLGLAFVLAAGGLGIAVLHQDGSPTLRAMAVAAMVAMTAPMMLAIWVPDRYLAVALAAALGVIFAAAGLMGKIFASQVRAATVPLGAAFLALAVVRFTDGDYLGYLFFTLAAGYFALAASTRFKPVFVVAWILSGIGFVHWLPAVAGLFAPVRHYGIETVAESLLGLLATLLAVRALRAFRQEWGNALVYLSWTASVAFASVAVVIAGTTIGLSNGDPYAGFQIAHAIVTVGWLLLTVLLLGLGLRRDRDSVAAVRLAIALATAAVTKLFLFDLRTLPDLARALAFLAVGVVMLGIGTWYHRQLEKARKPVSSQPSAGQSTAPRPVAPPPAPSAEPGSNPAPAPSPPAADGDTSDSTDS
jgi:hypothetical protein